MAMDDIESWLPTLKQKLTELIDECYVEVNEVTLEIPHDKLLEVSRILRDDDDFHFEQLIDLCGVDYLAYGQSDWQTESASGSGFSRAVESHPDAPAVAWSKPRFAVVYHLLSITNNRRLRLRCFVPEKTMTLPSVVNIWSSANWYEREAFDLFGIRFSDHDDLRRLLTDYGFSGYPFRKDFPLIGNVEIRYDATEKQCVYEPVSIEPRVLVPRVIRHDARYRHDEEDSMS